MKRSVTPLKRELKALLRRGSKGKRHKRTWGFSKNLLKVWPALWTFTTAPRVEPTNNAAERALRGPVIHRKLSLGSQSEAGERTIERLLSASVTCRLQRRSLFAYLADALSANARGHPTPCSSEHQQRGTERLPKRIRRAATVSRSTSSQEAALLSAHRQRSSCIDERRRRTTPVSREIEGRTAARRRLLSSKGGIGRRRRGSQPDGLRRSRSPSEATREDGAFRARASPACGGRMASGSATLASMIAAMTWSALV